MLPALSRLLSTAKGSRFVGLDDCLPGRSDRSWTALPGGSPLPPAAPLHRGDARSPVLALEAPLAPRVGSGPTLRIVLSQPFPAEA